MHQTFDVVIIGGALVGASLALALRPCPLRIAVIEPQPTPEPLCFPIDVVEDVDLRVSALSLASQRFLEHLGVWQALPVARVSPYQSMAVWDAQTSAELRFDAAELHQHSLGHVVENTQLIKVMHEALIDSAGKSAEVYWIDQPLVGMLLDDQGVEITLASGDALRANLVVGADGAHSQVRKLAGMLMRAWPYNQSAMVATIETEQPHQATAYQRFAATGPLAYLPLRAPHLSSIVWSLDDACMDELQKLPHKAKMQRIAMGLGHRLGSVTALSSQAVFPLGQCHAQSYRKGPVVLVGDAAHSLHPLAGQGVNLGFMDAAVLAEEIQLGLQRGLRPADGPVLMAYERRRMPENLMAMALMEALKRLFGSKQLSVVLARSLGMRPFDRLSWVRQQSVLVALGVAGDVPQCVKNHPLGFPSLDY